MNPKFFLVLTCLICTVMSVASGTSWGTLSTVGIALLGVSIGLKIPLPYVAGAIVVGSFFGDKMSPLSDSTIVAAASCDVPLIEHVKHMLYTTIPAYVISLLLFLFLGFQFDGSIAGEEYSLILTTLEKTFDMNIFMIIPPILVFVLIIMKKPAIPVFAIGILSAAILAVIFQGQDVTAVASTLASGCKLDTGEELEMCIRDSYISGAGPTIISFVTEESSERFISCAKARMCEKGMEGWQLKLLNTSAEGALVFAE